MRESASGMSAIFDVEMNLHVKLCAGWGLSPHDLEQAPPASETLAYTRYVLDTGMRGDLADAQGGTRALRDRLRGDRGSACSAADAGVATNPYRVWIDEYAGAPYQEVAAKARTHLDRLANLYVTPAREAELVTIFKEATRLETDFWEMGWRMGLRGV